MLKMLARISLRNRIDRDNAERHRKLLPWEKVERIALIINSGPDVNKSAVDRFIEETRKFIEVFYIETGSKQPSFGDWKTFVKKDKTLLNLPHSSIESELKSKKYDVVINASEGSDLFSVALASALPASFKCSGSALYKDSDIVVRRMEGRDLVGYLNDIVKYLKMIKV